MEGIEIMLNAIIKRIESRNTLLKGIFANGSYNYGNNQFGNNGTKNSFPWKNLTINNQTLLQNFLHKSNMNPGIDTVTNYPFFYQKKDSKSMKRIRREITVKSVSGKSY